MGLRGGYHEVQKMRQFMITERKLQLDFEKEWGWLIDEYENTRKQVKQLEKPPRDKPDERNPKPYPETTNQMYGWLASRPEFNLQFLGRDVPPKRPLPEIYDLMIDHLSGSF